METFPETLKNLSLMLFKYNFTQPTQDKLRSFKSNTLDAVYKIVVLKHFSYK